MTNEPIEEQDFRFGVNVVDIGDIRVSRGLTRRPESSCKHLRMNYDQRERRVWCRDCEQDVDNFDAFKCLVEQMDRSIKSLVERDKQLKEAEQFQIRSIAAKNIDKAWRKRDHIPCCPHCKNGLFPEDFKNGVSLIGREYAERRLAVQKGTDK